MAQRYSQCTLKHLDISWLNLDKSLADWGKVIQLCVLFQCWLLCVISGFNFKADENCVLLGYYAGNSGNSLLTFPDSHPVPFSKVKNSLRCRQDSWLLKNGPIGCPETSLRNYHYSVLNPLTPNDHYSGRTAPLTSKVAFYIFIQQI